MLKISGHIFATERSRSSKQEVGLKTRSKSSKRDRSSKQEMSSKQEVGLKTRDRSSKQEIGLQNTRCLQNKR